MNRLILLIIMSSFVHGAKSQSWDHHDDIDQRNQGWDHPSQRGRNQGNQGWDNPYQDPNYYPNAYGNRGCPPPPPPQSCRRNVVVVAPPPSFCAPVVIAPRPIPYYRPYSYNPYRRHHGHGYRHRGWRYR